MADMKNWALFIFLIIILISSQSIYGMSKAQVQKTLGIMKKQCVPKIGVTSAQVANIKEGDFQEDPKVKCYVACIYKSMQVIKNEKLNKEMIMRQIDVLFPPESKEAAKISLQNCMHIQDKYDEYCDAIFYSAKCMYEDNPGNFLFP